jgi:hypothetical protein
MVFLRIPSQGNVFGKEIVMKKAFFVALATLVAMSQFGCGSLKVAHDVIVHVLGVGWTADMLNLIP